MSGSSGNAAVSASACSFRIVLQAAQRRGLAGLVVEGEERRPHRAEQELAARTIAASVGHGLIGRVELVDGGRELAGVVVAHGLRVVLAGLGGQALRRDDDEAGSRARRRCMGITGGEASPAD
jgi:hypothetical protein